MFKHFETPILNGKQNSLTGPVVTGSFEKRAPGHLLFSLRAFTREAESPPSLVTGPSVRSVEETSRREVHRNYVRNYITATLFRELKFYKWKIITGGVFNLFL